MSERATFRRMHLSTSMTTTFTVNSKLSQELLDTSAHFWREKGINITSNQMLNAPKGDGEPSNAEMKGAGGSIWSLSFDKYRKKIEVSFTSLEGFTHVQVRVELPGAYAVSSDDMRKANRILEDFEKRLLAN